MSDGTQGARLKLAEEDPPVSLDTAQEPEPPRSSALGRPANVSISVENLDLTYPIGDTRASFKAALFGLFDSRARRRSHYQHVSALSGVSFNIRNGERVGIIGHNGSGKSSLLRVLAGAYPVRTGKVAVAGRIGTLLEIGLGFEPDATGRENIYYRGMSMGVPPSKLRKAEQEIVDFADIGEFIDLPVRTYSSGMYIRLGFAISTQFAPDILLIDEVIGAGDATFQIKARERMLDMVKHAGIVVLATHSFPLVEDICTRVLWLKGGQIRADGPPADVIAEFNAALASDNLGAPA